MKLTVYQFEKLIEPQITIWENWIKSYEQAYILLDNFNIFWDNVQNLYYISKIDALKCIKKYNWFISPSMHPYIIKEITSVCEQSKGQKYHKINKVFIDYFLNNNCENLDYFLKNWKNDSIFKNRMKIIKDCVNIIKNCPKRVNFSNFVVPTLIAQIDGIQNEFMKQNGLKINHNKIYELSGESLKDQHGQVIKHNQYFRNLTSNDMFFDAMNDVFLDVLFQRTQPGEDYKTSLHFSRHKILHGENVNYGKKDYTMRCFMILDFFHGLSINYG